MSGKHTPGPWFAKEAVGLPDEEFWSIQPAGGQTEVAISPRAPSPVREANARLIAAAPELLDLTKEYARTVEYYIKGDLGDGNNEGARMKTVTLNVISAAIAKAEGRAR